jgi:hypothetical protein
LHPEVQHSSLPPTPQVVITAVQLHASHVPDPVQYRVHVAG